MRGLRVMFGETEGGMFDWKGPRNEKKKRGRYETRVGSDGSQMRSCLSYKVYCSVSTTPGNLQ